MKRSSPSSAEQNQTAGQVVLLILFVIVEVAILLGSMVLGIVGAAAIAGQSSDTLSFGPFMVGFIGGLALGGLCIWPFERLCRHLTGSSAIDQLDWIPTF